MHIYFYEVSRNWFAYFSKFTFILGVRTVCIELLGVPTLYIKTSAPGCALRAQPLRLANVLSKRCCVYIVYTVNTV